MWEEDQGVGCGVRIALLVGSRPQTRGKSVCVQERGAQSPASTEDSVRSEGSRVTKGRLVGKMETEGFCFCFLFFF